MNITRSLLMRASDALAGGRFDSAVKHLKDAFPTLGGDAELAAQAGDLASKAGAYELAYSLYNYALQCNPGLLAVRYNRAATARFLGRIREAEEDYDSVIAVYPSDSEAWLNRSQLRRQTVNNNHVSDIERELRQRPKAWHDRMRLLYALAKEHEDLDNKIDCFVALRQANKIRRDHLEYCVESDISALNCIISTFNIEQMQDQSFGFSEIRPIFVLGLPRSGTTLIERILEAHPDVVSGGEMPAFGKALENCARDSGFCGGGKQALIPFSAKIDPLSLGRAYHAEVSSRYTSAKRVVDKLPMNFLYIGLISRALPNARIIHVYKPPLAVGWGMWKTLFVQGYPFSYDQFELGRYIGSFHRLMLHWQRVLPGRIHNVSYNTLVSDPENTIRDILTACELDWNDSCLAPHTVATANTSHSAAQIREPIHGQAIESWKAYAPFLDKMRSAMNDEGLADVFDCSY